MKQLVLMRHAKSSWDDERLDDHDRPLAPRGHRDAPRMGKRLARRQLATDLLLTSTARRARETADYIAAALAIPPSKIRADRAIYLASPAKLLGVLARIDDRFDSVLLVGHNPGLTELANRLLPSLHLDNLPTAAVVAIDCDAARWRDVESAAFTLRFYETPKKGATD